MEVLANIPVKLELEEVIKKLRLRHRNESVEKSIQELIELARPIARPKAVYKVAEVDNRNGDSLHINGVRFSSRVLRINLDKAAKVYPYVVTCGRELDEIKIPSHEYMRSYFWDQIKEMVVRSSLYYLQDYLKQRYEC
jgi:hypothetical protein